MGVTPITWEEVSQFEEIAGYSQHIWRHYGQYYLVVEEGGIATKRVVYELPLDLYRLIDVGERTLSEVHFKLRHNCWPPTEEERRLADKKFLESTPTALIADLTSWELFTKEELEELIPIAEKEWLEWKGKLPDNYVSPLGE